MSEAQYGFFSRNLTFNMRTISISEEQSMARSQGTYFFKI